MILQIIGTICSSAVREFVLLNVQFVFIHVKNTNICKSKILSLYKVHFKALSICFLLQAIF